MPIKKLQNNYTTPEQSKRLLELGIPADSADMYLVPNVEMEVPFLNHPYYLTQPFSQTTFIVPTEDVLPCWSVGQLIQIYEICTGLVWQNEIIDGYTKIDMLLEDFDDREHKYHFDFSKLEN